MFDQNTQPELRAAQLKINEPPNIWTAYPVKLQTQSQMLKTKVIKQYAFKNVVA